MYGFIAFLFDGKRTAHKAFEFLEDYTPQYAWIDDIAVISRSKHGAIRVHSTWAQEGSDIGAGTGLGALTGGLIGILFGPDGALAGTAAGGSLGALFGANADVVFDYSRLDDFAAYLGKDTSALIMVGGESALDDFVFAVEPFGGKIIETELDEEDINLLRQALKKAA